jgi:DNA-directed RNA polymerase specialized sigma24 family protein
MPIKPADEQLLQAVFEWAKQLFRRKGLIEHDAEDCAAEVCLLMLAHLTQGRTLSFAYAVQVARGVLADFVALQHDSPQPSRWKTPTDMWG